MSVLRGIGLTLTVSMFLTLPALTQEEKEIKRSDLPPACEKVLAEQIKGGATILRFIQEQGDNGQTLYEAQLMVNGYKRDVEMDASGEIYELEEQIPVDSLPAAVREALQAKAGKGKLVGAESITQHGKFAFYEAHIETDGKRTKLVVGPDGKPHEH